MLPSLQFDSNVLLFPPFMRDVGVDHWDTPASSLLRASTKAFSVQAMSGERVFVFVFVRECLTLFGKHEK